MKHLIKNLLAVLFLIVIIQQNVTAQDYHFSQYDETPLLINPAQTALHKDVRVIVNYKNQWSSVATPFTTYGLSGEFSVGHKRNKSSYLGLGFQVLSDKGGDTKLGTNLGLATLSGILDVDKSNKISLGLMGGFGQRTVNEGSFQWGSQYDNNNYNFNSSLSSGERAIANSFSFVDLGAGIAWSYGKKERYISANDGVKATVGISAYHFGVPAYSYLSNTSEKLDTKFIAHGRLSYGLSNSNMLIIPDFIYVRQGALQEINIGSTFKMITQEESKYTMLKKASAYSLGVHYRVGDALIFTAKFEYSNYAIGLSYDVNLSKLSAASNSNGGFEISLRFVAPGQFSSNRARI